MPSIKIRLFGVCVFDRQQGGYAIWGVETTIVASYILSLLFRRSSAIGRRASVVMHKPVQFPYVAFVYDVQSCA